LSSRSGDKGQKRISFHTERYAGEYLFSSKDLDESQFLDMRTRIKSEDTMRALIFYGVLSEGLECDGAKEIKDMIERMLIASDELRLSIFSNRTFRESERLTKVMMDL
jgi:hypothetical protein